MNWRRVKMRLCMFNLIALNRNYFIITGNENCIHQDNTSDNKNKERSKPIAFDKKGLHYYWQQKMCHTITKDMYRQQLICLKRALIEKCFEQSNRLKPDIFHHNNSTKIIWKAQFPSNRMISMERTSSQEFSQKNFFVR